MGHRINENYKSGWFSYICNFLFFFLFPSLQCSKYIFSYSFICLTSKLISSFKLFMNGNPCIVRVRTASHLASVLAAVVLRFSSISFRCACSSTSPTSFACSPPSFPCQLVIALLSSLTSISFCSSKSSIFSWASILGRYIYLLLFGLSAFKSIDFWYYFSFIVHLGSKVSKLDGFFNVSLRSLT